jgi:hypothetical protein
VTYTTNDTSHIAAWAEAEDLVTERTQALLQRGTDQVLTAAKQAIAELQALITKVEDHEDGGRALGSIRYFADHAGFSNSPATYVAETYQGAGKVAGLLEAL